MNLGGTHNNDKSRRYQHIGDIMYTNISRVMVFCEYCGKEILQKPYVRKQKYCSYHCANKANEERIHKPRKILSRILYICKYCDKEFLGYQSRYKSFCCEECEYEYYKLNPKYTGILNLVGSLENHPNWKGGKKLTWARNRKNRKQLNFELLFMNPFPEEVDVDYHHINNLLVIPLPRKLHMSCNHSSKVNLHRKECNEIIHKLYGLNLEVILDG